MFITLLLFFSRIEALALIFVYLYTRAQLIQKQIVDYEYPVVNEIGLGNSSRTRDVNRR